MTQRHDYKVTPTTETGLNSGRTRYRVECTVCGVEVHEATTGPMQMIERHEADYAGVDVVLQGHWLRVRDDSYRILFQLRTPGVVNVDPEEWTVWAEYKHCNLPGPGYALAEFLMKALAAKGETER